MLYLYYKAKNNAKKRQKKAQKDKCDCNKKKKNEFKKEAIKVVLKKF